MARITKASVYAALDKAAASPTRPMFIYEHGKDWVVSETRPPLSSYIEYGELEAVILDSHGAVFQSWPVRESHTS